jgi:hypothetical protein
VKQPGRFYPIDLDFDVKKDNDNTNEVHQEKTKTKLPTRLASLIELIFDVK